ncbi:MAG TPA: hypothetical protein VNN74_11015 [Candidatus Micrarchaeia archaeon]|nr:hypothetical protein [Candidatus Micrarchaeia archaeon]
MDAAEIIRQVEGDPGLRAQLRAVLLGDELLGLPRQVVRLADAQLRTEERLAALVERVERLAEAQLRTEERLAALVEAQRATEDRIGTLIGSVRELRRLFEEQGLLGEDAARMVLATVLREKGWTVLSDPESVDFGVGEADAVMRVRTDTGEEVVAVVEATLRLREADVRRWADRLDTPSWRKGLAEAGFEGPLLPYVYGAALYAGVEALSASLGIGVLLPAGERIAAASRT